MQLQKRIILFERFIYKACYEKAYYTYCICDSSCIFFIFSDSGNSRLKNVSQVVFDLYDKGSLNSSVLINFDSYDKNSSDSDILNHFYVETGIAITRNDDTLARHSSFYGIDSVPTTDPCVFYYSIKH